jgi:hypothetical protein
MRPASHRDYFAALTSIFVAKFDTIADTTHFETLYDVARNLVIRTKLLPTHNAMPSGIRLFVFWPWLGRQFGRQRIETVSSTH